MKATKYHIQELERLLDLLTRAELYINKSDGLAFETNTPNGGDYTIRNEALSIANNHTVTKPEHVTLHSKNGSPLAFINLSIRNLRTTIEKIS